MTLPNFLVIGAQKAGTTSLYHYLSAHPQVFMPRTKELHFFVEGLNGWNGLDCGWEKGWEWYEEHFADAGEALAVGEASPSYTAYPLRRGVAARIASSLPDVKLIYLLRHPVERARSQYIHSWINGLEPRPMASALLDEPSYLDKSSYAMQIEQYLEWFPRERLQVVISEDLRDDRERTMADVCHFLGVEVPAGWATLDDEFHRNDDKRVMTSVGRLLRRVPGYDRLAQHSPNLVREAYRATTTPRQDPRNQAIPDGVRREFERRLRPDLVRLGDIVPEALERWRL